MSEERLVDAEDRIEHGFEQAPWAAMAAAERGPRNVPAGTAWVGSRTPADRETDLPADRES